MSRLSHGSSAGIQATGQFPVGARTGRRLEHHAAPLEPVPVQHPAHLVDAGLGEAVDGLATFRTSTIEFDVEIDESVAIDTVIDRFPVLVGGKDKAGEFYRNRFGALFAYVTHRIPEITDALFKIDDAMKAGFGWEHGPFQIWDAVWLEKGLKLVEACGQSTAPWIQEMQEAGVESFYTVKEGATYFYDLTAKAYRKVPGQDAFIILDNIRSGLITVDCAGTITRVNPACSSRRRWVASVSGRSTFSSASRLRWLLLTSCMLSSLRGPVMIYPGVRLDE